MLTTPRPLRSAAARASVIEWTKASLAPMSDRSWTSACRPPSDPPAAEPVAAKLLNAATAAWADPVSRRRSGPEPSRKWLRLRGSPEVVVTGRPLSRSRSRSGQERAYAREKRRTSAGTGARNSPTPSVVHQLGRRGEGRWLRKRHGRRLGGVVETGEPVPDAVEDAAVVLHVVDVAGVQAPVLVLHGVLPHGGEVHGVVAQALHDCLEVGLLDTHPGMELVGEGPDEVLHCDIGQSLARRGCL